MSETVAILGTTFLCGISVLLAKLCSIRATVIKPEYVLISKEEYETMKQNALIQIQPQTQLVLPEYSEKEPLLDNRLYIL